MKERMIQHRLIAINKMNRISQLRIKEASPKRNLMMLLKKIFD
jgi:hypothetical protein